MTHADLLLKHHLNKIRGKYVKTIKEKTRPGIEYRKKQFFVDSTINKDIKYFSQSRGYDKIKEEQENLIILMRPQNLTGKKTDLITKYKENEIVELRKRMEENEVLLIEK